MAEIYQEVVNITISKLVKNAVDAPPIIIDEDICKQIESVIQEMLDDSSVIIDVMRE